MSVPDVCGAAIANLEVETLKHAKPTFHGDTIYAETRVLEKKETSDGRARHRHRRDQGHQPARRGGLLLPAQGDGLEARARAAARPALRRRRRSSLTESSRARASWPTTRINRPPPPRASSRARRDYERVAAVVPAPTRSACSSSRVGLRPGPAGARPRRRHRQAHPRCSAPPAPTSWRSSRWRRCGTSSAVACPASRSSTARPRRSRSTTRSVDVVTVAQAFHWFDAAAALGRDRAACCGPAARLALVWNVRDERSTGCAGSATLAGRGRRRAPVRRLRRRSTDAAVVADGRRRPVRAAASEWSTRWAQPIDAGAARRAGRVDQRRRRPCPTTSAQACLDAGPRRWPRTHPDLAGPRRVRVPLRTPTCSGAARSLTARRGDALLGWASARPPRPAVAPHP